MAKGTSLIVGGWIALLFGLGALKYSTDRYENEFEKHVQASATVRKYADLFVEIKQLHSSSSFFTGRKYVNQDAAQRAQAIREQINSMYTTNPEIKQLESDLRPYGKKVNYSLLILCMGATGLSAGTAMSSSRGTSTTHPSSSLKALFP